MATKKEQTKTTDLDAALANVPAQSAMTPEMAAEIAFKKHDLKRQKLVEVYRKEPKFPVTVSPFYAPYLGSRVPISLQGIIVYVPADGTPYYIPESYAAELIKAMAAIDDRQRRELRLSNVQGNIEKSIGEIKF